MVDTNSTDLDVMLTALQAETDKIEAGIDWGVIPTDASIETS